MDKATFYFDFNATTPVDREVLQIMLPYFSGNFGNPSSFHQSGVSASAALREARKQVALLLGAAEDSEIIFTSGGTESNNMAIFSALRTTGKTRIVTTSVEHSSIRKLCKQLEKDGFEIVELPVKSSGMLDLENLDSVLSDQTALVSVMAANNETGVVFPIQEIGFKLRERGILFHVDAVQAVGKIPFDLKNTPVDFLSLSAHKFYGPKGVGALYARKGARFQPFIFGGSQERGRRAGTENVPGIAGLGAACRILFAKMSSEIERVRALRDSFESIVMEEIPGTIINGASVRRIPNTSSLRFEGVDSEALLICLDRSGIFASSGSACMSGSREPSHVLKAMALSDEEANMAVRFSFGRYTTRDEIGVLIAALSENIARLRSLDASGAHRHETVVNS